MSLAERIRDSRREATLAGMVMLYATAIGVSTPLMQKHIARMPEEQAAVTNYVFGSNGGIYMPGFLLGHRLAYGNADYISLAHKKLHRKNGSSTPSYVRVEK